MDYNELKLRILTVLAKGQNMDGTAVARELSVSVGVTIDIHALTETRTSRRHLFLLPLTTRPTAIALA
jgi:hypothetical protein